MSALQIQTLLDEYELMKKDISDVDSTLFVLWCKYLRFYLYRKLSKEDPEKFVEEETINVSGGVSAYDLPANFHDMNAFGCGVYEQNTDGTTSDRRLARTSYGSTARGCFINKRQLVFTPPPVNAEVFVLRFLPVLELMDDVNDYFTIDTTETGEIIIDDEYIFACIQSIDVIYSQWDEDSGMESLAGQRFDAALDEIWDSYRTEADVQPVKDYSEMY